MFFFVFFGGGIICSEETHEAGLDNERGVEEHVWISGAAVHPDRHGNAVTFVTPPVRRDFFFFFVVK